MIARRCCRSLTKSPRCSSGVVTSSRMIGSSSTMPASRRPLLKASAAAMRKAISFDSSSRALAAEDGDLHVHQREAEQAAALALLGERLDGGRQERLRQGVAARGRDGHRRGALVERFHADVDFGEQRLPAHRRGGTAPVTSTASLDRLAVADPRLVDAAR